MASSYNENNVNVNTDKMTVFCVAPGALTQQSPGFYQHRWARQSPPNHRTGESVLTWHPRLLADKAAV